MSTRGMEWEVRNPLVTWFEQRVMKWRKIFGEELNVMDALLQLQDEWNSVFLLILYFISFAKGKRDSFVLACPKDVFRYIVWNAYIYVETYMDVRRLNARLPGFVTIAKVAGTPIWVKDTVRYETGEWKIHKLFVSFLNFSAYNMRD